MAPSSAEVAEVKIGHVPDDMLGFHHGLDLAGLRPAAVNGEGLAGHLEHGIGECGADGFLRGAAPVAQHQLTGRGERLARQDSGSGGACQDLKHLAALDGNGLLPFELHGLDFVVH
ncbi:hypothetical protein LP416_04840 [Polaromonas sp. P2-4]|nr:hypothetical protein LP416_04840 [Polaromonas sp. P2-4]